MSWFMGFSSVWGDTDSSGVSQENEEAPAPLQVNRRLGQKIDLVTIFSEDRCKKGEGCAFDLMSPHPRAVSFGRSVDGKAEQLKADRALSARIRRGDRSAWGDVYDRYAPLLYRRILMPRLASPPAAEDALSETFKSAIEHFDKYQDQDVGLYAWLCRIAHNKAMDMHRVKSVTGRKLTDFTDLMMPLLEPLPGADDLLQLRSEGNKESSTLAAALESLNPRYRAALTLRFLEEKSREECAKALEVKIATFDVLLLRALRSLRTEWQALTRSPSDE